MNWNYTKAEPTFRIDLVHWDPQLLNTVDGLTGKRLVDFKRVNLVDAQFCFG